MARRPLGPERNNLQKFRRTNPAVIIPSARYCTVRGFLDERKSGKRADFDLIYSKSPKFG